jgi:sugar/nucleoside kinase (ribokinase family)
MVERFDCYTQRTLFEFRILSVSSVDTVGAGDNFNAGFLRAWMDNQTMQTCLQWGNITGGLSTTELGGTTRKITNELVRQALTQFYPAMSTNEIH